MCFTKEAKSSNSIQTEKLNKRYNKPVFFSTDISDIYLPLYFLFIIAERKAMTRRY